MLLPTAQKEKELAAKDSKLNPVNFFFSTACKDGHVTRQVRSACKLDEDRKEGSTWQLVLLDIEDNGAFYRMEDSLEDLTCAKLEGFLADFRGGKLTRGQMS